MKRAKSLLIFCLYLGVATVTLVSCGKNESQLVSRPQFTGPSPNFSSPVEKIKTTKAITLNATSSHPQRANRKLASVLSGLVIDSPQDSFTPIISPSTSLELPLTYQSEAERTPASTEPILADGLYRDFWVWIGAGANYTYYSQTVQGFSDVKFGQIKAPSKIAHAGFFFTDKLGLDLNYRDTPGEVESSSIISVSNGTYKWLSLGAEMLYRPNESPWLIRAGMTAQELPFLVPLSANNITVTDASSTALSVGFEYRQTRKNMRLDYSLRYIHPISESSEATTNFDFTPTFNAQAAVGATLEVKTNIFLGIRFSADLQKNSFYYRNRLGTEFSGNQSVFSSTGELGLGYEF